MKIQKILIINRAPFEIALNRNQVEKLELEIIASGKARADEMRIQFVPRKG